MKAVFLTNIPAPHQVNFCNHIDNMDIHFVFCNGITENRPKYWNVDLSDRCIMLDPKKMKVFGNNRYINFDIHSVLRKINPDIIMLGGFTIPTYLLAYLWGKKHKKKVVVFTEISLHEKMLKLYNLLFGRIDAILAVGQKGVEQYKQYFKHIPIYNFSYAADLERRLTIKRSFDSNREIKFLYASRFIENYNPQILIKAFEKLSVKYKYISLTMSSNGPLKEQCKELVNFLQLEDKISFIDHFESWEDINHLYEDNDILVFPASFNSWGLVIPEAMASAMPIVTTPYVIGSELLDCDLAEPNINSLHDAMEFLILNRNEIKKQALSNREKSISQSFEHKAKQLKQIFESILSN